MKQIMKKLEAVLEKGGVKKDVTLLVISGISGDYKFGIVAELEKEIDRRKISI